MSKTHQGIFSPKIAIYGVGKVGQMLARIAHEKGWEVVAAYNRAGEKVGQDLGQLAGLDKDLGVVVQDCDIADYANPKADIALVAVSNFLEENFPAYERLLSSGVNVLCHGGGSINPRWSDPEVAEKIDALAKANNVTFTGTGIWDMTRVWAGILVAGPCLDIESLKLTSNAELLKQSLDFAPYVGIGMTVEEYDQKVGRSGGMSDGMLEVPAVCVLQSLGYTVTEFTNTREPIVWDEDAYCPYLKKALPAGICVGSRTTVEVLTEEGVTATCELEYRVFREGEKEEIRWAVQGRPSLEISVARTDADITSQTSLFNRIPDVIAADPGIVEIMKMGPERPSALL